jgi:tetratricopeptide (TPR) repeat protein
MESTWQTANESLIGSLSLREKERWIVSLNNLLSELDDEKSKTKSQLLNRLGQLYDSLGKYDKALECYQQNRAIQQSNGDKQGECSTLYAIAQIYKDKGDKDTASHYWVQSMKIRQAIGNNQIKDIFSHNLSQIYNAKDYNCTTLDYLDLEQLLKSQHNIGDKQGEVKALNDLAAIAYARDDKDTALRYFEQSLKTQQDIGDKQGECSTLCNIGHIYHINGDQQRAQTIWLKSYKIAKQTGFAKGLRTLEKLAKELGGIGLDFWEKLSQEI